MSNFRVEYSLSKKEKKVIPLTDAEIAERQARAEEYAQINARARLEERARLDAMEYLMDFVASQPDAPQSVKDLYEM